MSEGVRFGGWFAGHGQVLSSVNGKRRGVVGGRLESEAARARFEEERNGREIYAVFSIGRRLSATRPTTVECRCRARQVRFSLSPPVQLSLPSRSAVLFIGSSLFDLVSYCVPSILPACAPNFFVLNRIEIRSMTIL